MPAVSYPNQAIRNAALKQDFLSELNRLIDKYSDVVQIKDMCEYKYYYHVELILPR